MSFGKVFQFWKFDFRGKFAGGDIMCEFDDIKKLGEIKKQPSLSWGKLRNNRLTEKHWPS